eukprot:scaffold292168_cov33-Tisochrysis_lutea.AAC.1
MAVDSKSFSGTSSAVQFAPPPICALAYAAAPPPSPAPRGPPPAPWLCFSGPLVGQNVSVPETTCRPGSDRTGHHWTGTVALQASGPDRVLVHFACSGEKEWFNMAQVTFPRQSDVSPLCDSFAAL